MTDTKPFNHGEEGTHSVCNKHNIGGKSVCCECSGEVGCGDEPMKTKPNITDKNNNEVNFGDKYLATMITPSTEKGTVVTVVIDLSKENIDCDRNFNVEDDEGNRIWNAYMVIRTSEPLTNQSEEEKNKYDKNKI